MAPKKDKNKADDAAAQKTGTNGFTEVDRTFLELQVTELNRKIARLRSAVDEYEQRNEELQKAYDQLDEDRADIIAYLKKTLNMKNEENNELKDKVKGLEETREIETKEFNANVAELERNFTIMKDQLTSENKLLASKLNTLEEFRAIRDDLMRKFEKQEEAFQEQEMKYKRIIYDTEKKFVIGKDKLKKEMEARLLQLAQDFQDATELRIAASTHRVIRENIAINHELDNILSTQAKLSEQNEKFKESEKAARIAKTLAEEERDKAINKNVVQLKVIEQLTTAFQDLKKQKAIFEMESDDYIKQKEKNQRLTKENDTLSLQVRILEQRLHAKITDENKASVEASKVTKECSKLRRILQEASVAIKKALKLDEWAAIDPTREIIDRQELLSQLLDIVTKHREIQTAESMETLASFGKVYEEGDLGFIPKLAFKKSGSGRLSSSRESIERQEDQETKRSALSISSPSYSPSSLGSMKTIPSMKVMPEASQEELASQDSLLSFVTSTKSTVSDIIEEEKPGEDTVTDQLELSKLELQKSIMQDLMSSQVTMQPDVDHERISLTIHEAEKPVEGEPESKLKETSKEESGVQEIKDEKALQEKAGAGEQEPKEESVEQKLPEGEKKTIASVEEKATKGDVVEEKPQEVLVGEQKTVEESVEEKTETSEKKAED